MDYHINKDGQTEGPLGDLDFHRRVMDGRIGPDDLVWSEGWEEWKTLRESGLLIPTKDAEKSEAEPPDTRPAPFTPAANTPHGILFRIKPPYWTATFLVTGVLLHYAFPILRVPGWGSPGLAFLLGTGSLMLLIWSIAQFMHKDTPLDTARSAKSLVLEGPYHYSRNPIYTAMVGLTAAFAIGYGTLPALMAPVALYFVLARVFVSVEEKRLSEQFGDDYQSYCAKVRRWI